MDPKSHAKEFGLHSTDSSIVSLKMRNILKITYNCIYVYTFRA